MSTARTEIGRVRSVNPAKREVRVTPRPGFESALNGRSDIEFVLRDGGRKTLAVETVEEQDRCVKLTLVEGTSADVVASLRGAKVRSDAVKTEPDDPFAIDPADLTGFTVWVRDGEELGVVAGGFVTPAHGVIEIDRGGAASLLAPFVREVVSDIDWTARRIVVNDAEAHMVENDTGGTMA